MTTDFQRTSIMLRNKVSTMFYCSFVFAVHDTRLESEATQGFVLIEHENYWDKGWPYSDDNTCHAFLLLL